MNHKKVKSTQRKRARRALKRNLPWDVSKITGKRLNMISNFW